MSKQINAMERIILTVVLASVCCWPLLGKICGNNDDGPVVVIVKDKQTTGHTQTNRVPVKVQVECFYYPSVDDLELSFLSDLGTVNVTLENQTSGEIQDYAGDSSIGLMVIPVSPNSAYRMDITTENGRGYYALFRTEDNNND